MRAAVPTDGGVSSPRASESATPQLRHEAGRCSGPADLVRAACDAVVSGLSRGEACLLVADRSVLDPVRAALGDDAGTLTFVDLAVDGRNPNRLVPLLSS